MLAWLSVWNEVQTCIWSSRCHCHSLSLAPVKSRLVLPFWYIYRLTWVVPDKGPLNGCACVLLFLNGVNKMSVYLSISQSAFDWCRPIGCSQVGASVTRYSRRTAYNRFSAVLASFHGQWRRVRATAVHGHLKFRACTEQRSLNESVQRNEGRLRWEGFAEKEGSKPAIKECRSFFPGLKPFFCKSFPQ